jgi:hypothetical protein
MQMLNMIKPGHRARLLALLLPVLCAAGAPAVVIPHQWRFDEPAGTPLGAVLDSGAAGGAAFSGGSPDWAADGAGALALLSASGTGLLQASANMGPSIAGRLVVRYDLSWNFATALPGVNRELFLINRTASGASPSGNRFRFAVSNFSGASGGAGQLQIATTAAGVAGAGSYAGPVTIANLETDPAGSASLRVSFTFNANHTRLEAVDAAFSLDGGASWTAMELGGEFSPYALTNLGDLRIHAKGDFNELNCFRIDGISVAIMDDATAAAGQSLQIVKHQDALRLQWPDHYTGWRLQSATSLDEPSGWSDHPDAPQFAAGRAFAAAAAPQPGAPAFFRLAREVPANPYPLFINPGHAATSGPDGWTWVGTGGRVVTDSQRTFQSDSAILATSWRDKPDSHFNNSDQELWHSEAHKAAVGANHDTRWIGLAVNFDSSVRSASRTFAQWMDDQGWYPAVMLTLAPAFGSPANSGTAEWRITMKVIRDFGDEFVVTLLQGTVAEIHDTWHRFAVKTRFTTGSDGYVQVYHAWPGRPYRLVDLDNGATYRGRTFRNYSGNGSVRLQTGCYAHWAPDAAPTDAVRNWIGQVRIADGAASLHQVAP